MYLFFLKLARWSLTDIQNSVRMKRKFAFFSSHSCHQNDCFVQSAVLTGHDLKQRLLLFQAFRIEKKLSGKLSLINQVNKKTVYFQKIISSCQIVNDSRERVIFKALTGLYKTITASYSQILNIQVEHTHTT